MIDLGVSKLALIGVVALVVIGPEKLPRVARTLGTWVGKAQRYVADMKSEMNKAVELDELRKMKEGMDAAVNNVEQTVREGSQTFEQSWSEATSGLNTLDPYTPLPEPSPQYEHPKKKWRLKRAAVPRWYKSRSGIRSYVQSGAARVARHKPKA